MSESFHVRRLAAHAYRPRQHRIAAAPPHVEWLCGISTVRRRYLLTALLLAALLPLVGLYLGLEQSSSGESETLDLPWRGAETRRPVVRYHTVAEGESLQSIADR